MTPGGSRVPANFRRSRTLRTHLMGFVALYPHTTASQPCTANRIPYTPHLEPRTQNPKPETRNPNSVSCPRNYAANFRRSRTLRTHLMGFVALYPHTTASQPCTANRIPYTPHLEPRTQNPKPETQNLKPETRIPYHVPVITSILPVNPKYTRQ
jgi:hypothetical protein